MSFPLTASVTPESAWPTLRFRSKTVVLDGRPKMVGILNVTPDSFFDGGRHHTLESALDQAIQMAAEGAAIIDVGGESTRPGHVAVTVEEEIARVGPVIEMLARRIRIPLSIDTHKPAVARAAIAAGAEIINDVHGFQGDPELAKIAAQHGCGVILMHHDASFSEMRGATMERIAIFLNRSLAIAVAAGVPRERIILDPGIGFGKTHEQNLEILARLGELKSLGCPLLLGASRKSVIGNVVSLPADERLAGTLATTALAVWQGVEFLRVHDVRANLQCALMAKAILDACPVPTT